MTEQTPEPAVDETEVPQIEKTTNNVAEFDDVEFDDDQTPVAQEDLGHTFEPVEDGAL